MGRKTGFGDAYRYNNYINSPAWKAKAKQRLELDNHICCVCGRQATEVHHLTYINFENEPMDDLVSLCHECHEKAEEIYDPSIYPWEINKKNGRNFMASMRIDAEEIAQVVFDYLLKVNGNDFKSLWRLRQPEESDKKNYWIVLRKAVNALCHKRYEIQAEDRTDIVLRTVSNHTIVLICLASIEHFNRNQVQRTLQDDVNAMHEILGTWKAVAEDLGISEGTLTKLKNDDGSSSGPSIYESVLYYCSLDAVAGIKPDDALPYLAEEDFQMLNSIADYMENIYSKGGLS